MIRRLSAELIMLNVVVEAMALQPGSGGFPAEKLFPDVLLLTPLFPLFPPVILGYFDSIVEGLCVRSHWVLLLCDS